MNAPESVIVSMPSKHIVKLKHLNITNYYESVFVK